MIKKIRIEQLRLGMYIHDLLCGWITHPFIKNRFLLERQEDLEKILGIGSKELFIDTSKGDDVSDRVEEEAPPPDALSEAASHLAAVHSHGGSLKMEMALAKKIQAESVNVVRGIMKEMRTSGARIQAQELTPVVKAITDSVFVNSDATLSLGRIKQKDAYTFQHSVNVCALLVGFGKFLGLDAETVEQLGIGGLIHDAGKMLVPEAILNKPGPLRPDEMAEVKEHVRLGRELFENAKGVSDIAREVLELHHERLDGSGYPRGLKQGEISRIGLMAAVVDVYDACTSDRVYQGAAEPTEVLRNLYEWSKSLFSEEVVGQFIHCIGIYPTGSLVRLQSEQLAVVVKQGKQNILQPVVKIVYDLNEMRKVLPRFADLSRPNLKGVQDRIVCHESAAKWKIDPMAYLVS